MTTAIGELCMGYGGLGMGLSLALGGDTRVAWAVEYDKHPSAIIAHRYPGITNYGDVKTAPWHDMEPVDWLTAGYPCQPFSPAGHKKGNDDPRHLWPAVATAIGVLRPRHILLENVARHLVVGFSDVLADLARLGYDARWGVVRASDAGAPHSRARLFVVAAAADPEGVRRQEWFLRSGDAAQEPAPADGPTARDWGRYRRPVASWERIVGRPAPAPNEVVRAPSGYGRIGVGGKGSTPMSTHRLAWQLAHGPIPDGLFVCHHCDNPPCCNVDHLFLGTPLDNVTDMDRKGRRVTPLGADHPRGVLSDEDVAAIRSRYVPPRPGFRSNGRALADEFGVTTSGIHKIATGLRRLPTDTGTGVVTGKGAAPVPAPTCQETA